MYLRNLAGTIGVAVGAMLLASGCSSSSGTHTQSVPATSSSTATSPASVGSRTSSSPTDPSSPSLSTGKSSAPVATPTVTPPAQGAVNAYVASYNAGIAALRDPASADLSWIAKYETGKFRTQDEQSFAYLKAHHLAYRGATPDPNVKVQSVVSPKFVILTSCQIVDRSHPWVQYDTRTGKAVPRGNTRTPPPPYLLQLFMKLDGPEWQVSSVAQDTRKTCKA